MCRLLFLGRARSETAGGQDKPSFVVTASVKRALERSQRKGEVDWQRIAVKEIADNGIILC
jgi:hypothetical protein